MRSTTLARMAAAFSLLTLATGSAHAGELGQFFSGDSLVLDAGEIHRGDLYVGSAGTRISGRQEGDLFAWSGQIRIDGEVTGDVNAGGQSLKIEGTVSDTVRYLGQFLTIHGTVEGDVIVMAQGFTLAEGARVTGNVIACTGTASLDGTIDGSLTFAGGEMVLGGSVGKNARLETDTIRLTSGASIGGDLTYHSRRELDLDPGAVVAGETTFERKTSDEVEQAFFATLKWMFWIWRTLAAMVVGLVAVALTRRFLPDLVAPIERDTLMGGLIGFGTFLVVPAAAAIAILLLITAPLGLLLLALFLVALYLAKLPVAVWLGRRLLMLAGRPEPSPYLSVLLGLLLIYIAFALPYFLGDLAKAVVTWLGLGALILAVRSRAPSRSPVES